MNLFKNQFRDYFMHTFFNFGYSQKNLIECFSEKWPFWNCLIQKQCFLISDFGTNINFSSNYFQKIGSEICFLAILLRKWTIRSEIFLLKNGHFGFTVSNFGDSDVDDKLCWWLYHGDSCRMLVWAIFQKLGPWSDIFMI